MNLLGASTRQERRCSAPFGVPQTRSIRKKKLLKRSRSELYFFPSPIFPRESVKNDRKPNARQFELFVRRILSGTSDTKFCQAGMFPPDKVFIRSGNVTWAWHVRVGKATFMPALFSRRCERALIDVCWYKKRKKHFIVAHAFFVYVSSSLKTTQPGPIKDYCFLINCFVVLTRIMITGSHKSPNLDNTNFRLDELFWPVQ